MTDELSSSLWIALEAESRTNQLSSLSFLGGKPELIVVRH